MNDLAKGVTYPFPTAIRHTVSIVAAASLELQPCVCKHLGTSVMRTGLVLIKLA